MNIDKRLLKYLKPKKSDFALTIISGIAAGIFTIAQALTLSSAINKVFINHQTLNDIRFVILYFLMFSVVKALFVWLEQNFANKVVIYIKQEIRGNLLDKLMRLGPVSIKKERSGELTNTITEGVEKLDAYFSQYLPQLFLSAIIPLIILFAIFPIDLLTGIIFLITAPLIPLFMWLIGSAAESLNRKQWKSLSRMSAYFLDVIQGITTIKLFNRGRTELKKIFEISENFRRTTMGVLRIAFVSALVLELLSTISIAIVAVEIGLRLLHGNILFKDALFILIIAPEFYLPIRQLGTRFHAGLEGVAAFQRINTILNKNGKNVKILTHKIKDSKTEIITFKNCSFTYSQRETEAVKNLNFTLEPEQKTALAGYSGSGKTTIGSLLLRFIKPESGNILFGNTDINKFTLNSWREKISWIPQNPYLFHGTIEDNLKIARPDAHKRKLDEAAEKANIRKFIDRLPNKYNTIIGEKGTLISGGQAQRIALARAFLKDAPIILLDEPTANLDPIVENLILESIDILLKNKTSLIIAHRLNTIINADKIIVLAGGKTVEQGTHNQLLKLKGVYTELYKNYTRKNA